MDSPSRLFRLSARRCCIGSWVSPARLACLRANASIGMAAVSRASLEGSSAVAGHRSTAYAPQRRYLASAGACEKDAPRRELDEDSPAGAHHPNAMSRPRFEVFGVSPFQDGVRHTGLEYSAEDRLRFAAERVAFRADPRLQAAVLESLADGSEQLDMNWKAWLVMLASSLRLTDQFIEPFRDLCADRVTNQPALMELVGIASLEDRSTEKPLHSKLVPQEGEYFKMRMQAYWLAIHVWLLHSKQHLVQQGEGALGSLACSLLTRRLFEWQWNQLRGWMFDADVPAMSLTGEVQDMQEFIFGFCAALDEAFKEEAATGTIHALLRTDDELNDGQFGLAPRVKFALWQNVYSGGVPHESVELHELTTYLLLQRASLEAQPRGTFFNGDFSWASFSSRE